VTGPRVESECYNTGMDRSFRPFQTGSDADIAFAVMVLAAYFSTFSLMQTTSAIVLLVLIGLGIAYIAIGIYGYAFAVRSGRPFYHMLYFAVQIFLGGLIVFYNGGTGFNAMVLLPLAGHSVVLLPNRWRFGVNILIVLTYIVALTHLSQQNWGLVWAGLPIFLAGQIFIVVFTQMAVSEEKARSAVERLNQDLEAANQRLREYAMQAEELAIIKERNRLAREIHDGLGHYLTTIYMQIQAARAVMKTDLSKAMEALGTAQNQTQEALIDVRQSVSALRDPLSGRLTFQEEVEKMLKNCDGAGLMTELKTLGSPRALDQQKYFSLYRAVQEGINNTLKHARASRLSVVLDFTQADRVKLVIQDDGVGAEQVNGGFGLMGIQERIYMLSGEVSIVSEPGNGFRLEVCVPG